MIRINERQLENIQLDRPFTDKATGRDAKRPKLENLVEFAREGDTVIVHSMDRLARESGISRETGEIKLISDESFSAYYQQCSENQNLHQ